MVPTAFGMPDVGLLIERHKNGGQEEIRRWPAEGLARIRRGERFNQEGHERYRKKHENKCESRTPDYDGIDGRGYRHSDYVGKDGRANRQEHKRRDTDEKRPTYDECRQKSSPPTLQT